jgi:hypothetical protein
MSKNQERAEKPAVHFDEPHHVIADSELSPKQKAAALDTLEQDARQLATASAEGMTGGEETKLNEVLHAKEILESPGELSAYQVVMQDLRARSQTQADPDTRVLIANAIAAIEPLLLRLQHQQTDLPEVAPGQAEV